MAISRRSFFLRGTPLTLAVLLPEHCQLIVDPPTVPPAEPIFVHGVASGDPLAHQVVIWTRVTRSASTTGAVIVRWEMATDVRLRHVVAAGKVATDIDVDDTVKVDVGGLEPGRTYYYRFHALGQVSPVGRTKTLPTGRVERVRVAFASCSNLPYGYFNAYRNIAERADLDAVLHLGDYLYEYANGEYGDGAPFARAPVPNREIVSLADYRTRHAQYKQDPDLQEAHRQHPFITVWDDHEIANDAWRDGAQNHQDPAEGTWSARRAAAVRAYHEWMPIRAQPSDGENRIYRSFSFGDLVDLVMLDTRVAGRDRQPVNPCDPASLADPSRQLLGAAQEAWFVSELTGSRAQWRVIGQQVMFGQLVNAVDGATCVFNPDQWDGYAAARTRVLQTIAANHIDNVVVLTGDIHSSWGNDIVPNPFDGTTYDPATGAGSLAVEFVTPAVTSPGIDDPAQAAGFASAIRQSHPHVKFVELNRRGYALLDVTPGRAQAEWYHVASIQERTSAETLAAALQTRTGENHLVPAPAPSIPRPAPALAPVTTRDYRAEYATTI